MTRKRHPCARTNATLRREIQESLETNKALAARLGLNLKTVAKWRSRATTSDARKGPRPVSTVLSATEEALIVVFRKHTRFPLDVCLAHLKPRIPALSRSALHRCLKRYRVSRIPRGLAEKPPKFDLGRQSAHFTIEVCALPGEAGDYLYAAINQTRFVFAKVMKGVSPYDAADFLEDLRKNAPTGISSVITSDHEAFTHPAGEPWSPPTSGRPRSCARPRDRRARILRLRMKPGRFARPVRQSSASGWATKIRTRRIEARMRNAGCWPFQTCDCHIANHSPPTARKAMNQTRNPQPAPAKTNRLAW